VRVGGPLCAVAQVASRSGVSSAPSSCTGLICDVNSHGGGDGSAWRRNSRRCDNDSMQVYVLLTRAVNVSVPRHGLQVHVPPAGRFATRWLVEPASATHPTATPCLILFEITAVMGLPLVLGKRRGQKLPSGVLRGGAGTL
jgi:hypothetical protein